MSRRRKQSPRAPRPAAGERAAPAPPAPKRRAGEPPRGRPSVKAPREQAPPAPWDPFPLTELVILLGIVLALLGLLIAGGARRIAMVGGGLGLIGLASSELAFREHFAGHRSHTTLLAAIPAVIVASLLWLLANRYDLFPPLVAPIALVVIFALGFWRLRELFKRRSGGLGFRA